MVTLFTLLQYLSQTLDCAIGRYFQSGDGPTAHEAACFRDISLSLSRRIASRWSGGSRSIAACRAASSADVSSRFEGRFVPSAEKVSCSAVNSVSPRVGPQLAAAADR